VGNAGGFGAVIIEKDPSHTKSIRRRLDGQPKAQLLERATGGPDTHRRNSLHMRFRITVCIVLAAAAAWGLTPGFAARPEDDVRAKIRAATSGFRDFTIGAKIAYSNQKELAIIGKDYGKSYQFKNSTIIFKMPDKVKVTSTAGVVNVSYIITGNMKRIRAGLLKKTEDISNEPHKKQTPLDVGVVTEAIWKQFRVDNVKMEGTAANPTYVLTLSLSNSPQKKQYIWVDGKDLRLLKREKHEADGSLKSRYVYSKHKEYKGVVWVPGEQRVYNKNGKLAGTTAYSNIKVNTGVADGVFQ